MSETVMLDVELKSPIERVWHALTDPAQLSKWMMFEAKDFEPVVGHRFQFRTAAMGGWNGIIDCEVLQVDAPRRLSYTWVGGPQAMVVETTVVWTLTEAQGVTRLHLEQSGFPAELKQAIGGARYGWTRMLDQLKNVVNEEAA